MFGVRIYALNRIYASKNHQKNQSGEPLEPFNRNKKCTQIFSWDLIGDSDLDINKVIDDFVETNSYELIAHQHVNYQMRHSGIKLAI